SRLELGPDAHAGLGRQAPQLDERGVADRLDQVAVATAARLVLERGDSHFRKCSQGGRAPTVGVGLASTQAAALALAREDRVLGLVGEVGRLAVPVAAGSQAPQCAALAIGGLAEVEGTVAPEGVLTAAERVADDREQEQPEHGAAAQRDALREGPD